MELVFVVVGCYYMDIVFVCAGFNTSCVMNIKREGRLIFVMVKWLEHLIGVAKVMGSIFGSDGHIYVLSIG